MDEKVRKLAVLVGFVNDEPSSSARCTHILLLHLDSQVVLFH